LNRQRSNSFLKTPAMRLSFAGIVTTFRIETVYEKRQDLAQQAGCSEPRDGVSVSCRASLARGR
jgi:hypothetical protein